MFRERKNGQRRSHAFLPHKQVQNAKIESSTAISRVAKSKSNSLFYDGLPQYCRPPAPTGASREGSFVVSTNRHGCASFPLARLGRRFSGSSKVIILVQRIAQALLAEFTKIILHFPDAHGQVPSRNGVVFWMSGPLALQLA